jgi:hypothetical protein
MSIFVESRDALVVAIPMVAMMFVRLFSVDEMLSRRSERALAGRHLSFWGSDGNPECIEPDGTLYCPRTRTQLKPMMPEPDPRHRQRWQVVIVADDEADW